MIWDLGRFGDREALVDEGGGRLTYGELEVECARLARALGWRRLVFCLCGNTIGSVLGYVALMNSGSVPLLLNKHLDPALLEGLLAAYQPPLLWAPADREFPGADVLHEAWGYRLLRTHHDRKFPLHPDLALLLTTSGSTGSPKLVRQSRVNVLDNAGAIARYLELDEAERPITALPMNYTYGLSIINSHLLAGGALLLTERSLMQREFWGFLRGAGATSLSGVPYTYEMLDRLRFQRMDLPSLRTLTQAGGKLLPALHKKFAEYAAERGKRFIVMYGQCEATARMGYLPAERALDKCGAMGIAIPGGRFRLMDAEGNEIRSPGVTGELVYEGKNVTLGYAERGEDLAKGDERGGVLWTGDMAQFDEEGFFTIVGRRKRFLKLYGNRVNLDEVEALVKTGLGLDCACAGVDDRLSLFITAPGREEEARDFLAHRTGLNPAAFRVTALEAIPKNESGKTLYSELERYGS